MQHVEERGKKKEKDNFTLSKARGDILVHNRRQNGSVSC